MKVETIEEFRARGGIVKVIPPQPAPETKHQVSARSAVDHQQLSLDCIYIVPVSDTQDEEPAGLRKLLASSWLPNNIKSAIISELEVVKKSQE